MTILNVIKGSDHTLKQVFAVIFFIIITSFIVLADQSQHKKAFRALKRFEIKATAAEEISRPAVNTINGSGLYGDLSDNRWDGTWITASNDSNLKTNFHPGTTKGATWIKYEFNKVYNLREMKVWNYNEDVNRGFKDVIIEYSVDGRTWKKLGNFTIAKGTGKINYSPNTTINFKNLAAKAVVITAREGAGIGNYGSTMYGLSEVRFYVRKDPLEKAPFMESGRFGRAMRFDSQASHWLEIPVLPDYNKLPLTIEWWAKIEAKDATNVFITTKKGMIGLSANSDLFCGYAPVATEPNSQEFADSRWHYFAVVLEDGRICGYVDGVKKIDQTKTDIPNLLNLDGSIYLGASPENNLGFEGLIDEVRISNVVREVLQVPVSPFAADANTIGLWHLDDINSDRTLDDDSVSQNSAHFLPPSCRIKLDLKRGLTIDRQFTSVPPPSQMLIDDEDIKLIKSMKFEFIKLLINPACFMDGSTIDASVMWYLDGIVNKVVAQGLPVVVCVHPEEDFKHAYLNGGQDKFSELLGFYGDLAAYLAGRWGPDQLAFQFMTEPQGSSTNPYDWNYWDKLQDQIWKTVRSKMPSHTLILSGDMTGQIEGLLNTKPVNDENVIYSFTFYEPMLFTFQGGPSSLGLPSYIKQLPYPSNPKTIKKIHDYLRTIPDDMKVQIRGEIKRYTEELWNRDRLSGRIKILEDWSQYYGGGYKLWCAEFGCLQYGSEPADRAAYIKDIRSVFDEFNIDWSYWSYNETFSVMSYDRVPFGPANEQTADIAVLKALMPDKFMN